MTVSKITLLASLMLASVFSFADCPDGGRDTSTAERTDYVETTTALRTSLPAAPAGWRILDRYTGAITAPNTACKGSTLIPGYYVTYIWTDQEQRVRKVEDDKSKRIVALQLLTPDEQKQVDDFGRQARALERQAIAVLHTNPDEAARLRKQEEPFVLQVRAIRQAHRERVVPQITSITSETVPGVTGVSTEIPVSISVRKDPFTPGTKAEKVQIAGAKQAAYNGKELNVLLGVDSKGRNIMANITGSRSEAETIANLLAASFTLLIARK
ncbi:MAG TPA: hypothetical protein VLK33_02465 [Terriglobales bacterium]|nr:hypothetical protein [Terriglobales bacterium]